MIAINGIPNIRYVGVASVRLNGINVKHGESINLPEHIVQNLILDKKNWERITPPVDSQFNNTSTVKTEVTPPDEEKKKKKKGGEQ